MPNAEIGINNLPHLYPALAPLLLHLAESARAPQTKRAARVKFHLTAKLGTAVELLFGTESTRVWQFVKTGKRGL